MENEQTREVTIDDIDIDFSGRPWVFQFTGTTDCTDCIFCISVYGVDQIYPRLYTVKGNPGGTWHESAVFKLCRLLKGNLC